MLGVKNKYILNKKSFVIALLTFLSDTGSSPPASRPPGAWLLVDSKEGRFILSLL